MINAGDKFEFGFPDFAETIFAEYGQALQLAYTDSHLANEMLGALPTGWRGSEVGLPYSKRHSSICPNKL